ncbi:hypothetical protein BDZ94DRAFT_1255225 [Collybia nuda]|uniref:Uncharacterized protein n=1 Tax=Collybia nuda TaxID=64659 RepID=A0A9P5YCC7_9AGAR|nr:hypothetical protein BDZ94DRAFT_1255225 [Collybia nuda]
MKIIFVNTALTICIVIAYRLPTQRLYAFGGPTLLTSSLPSSFSKQSQPNHRGYFHISGRCAAIRGVRALVFFFIFFLLEGKG